MAAQKKQQAEQIQQPDLSEFENNALRQLRRMITAELKARKAKNERCPDIGTRVKVLHGARRDQIGVVALHMANRTVLIQFPGGGMSRVHLSRLEVVQQTT